MAWSMAKLGDVCNIVGGGTPSKSNNDYYGGGIPWATVRDMKQDLLSITELTITAEAIKNSSTNLIPSGTVITATRVGLGKVCVLQQDTAINQDLKAIIPKNNNLDKTFLYWWLKSVSYVIEAAGVGATVKGVRLAFVKSLEIPLPPIPEQKRIVAILDQAFAEIDQARANAQQNFNNARELFESYLQQVFSQRGEGWKVKSISEITTILGDGLHGTPRYSENGDYYFINGNNLNDGVIKFKEKTKKVTEEEFKKYEKKLTSRTVLVSINGTLGNVAFYNDEKIILGKSACYFNLIENIDKQYVKYVIESPLFQGYAQKVATGATIKNVSLKSMRAFLIPVAPEKNSKIYS